MVLVVVNVYAVCKMISFAGTAGYRGQQQQQKATSKQKHTKLPYIADYFVCVRGWIDDCTDIASDSAAAAAVDETFIPSAAAASAGPEDGGAWEMDKATSSEEE